MNPTKNSVHGSVRVAGVLAAVATAGTLTTALAADAEAANYRDGTYSATGNYTRPGGPDKINVTVTLKKNIVRSVRVTPGSSHPVASRFQRLAAGSIASQVVGKNIDSVNVGKTAGSSLTPKGFNNAISKIKSQARR
ncbi:FMN-binding protein [Gordonia sp. (in: high G+C Gram-positive bacteria)]|uniref:FMN-binding protein n=1 Tax=Gordonia sp. (in: high G+C Gram-positive bacteria) TaxID=84139 RepID=UPI001DFCF80A|nr:FMN-binding protein [Gordonia sp. (in: high G+C Gram-positive bacteria)]MCB1294964.1 FMN-binding protein [Gordonia sp. (in: high G+C Gram-positive bacteria)]HMS75420.1 FMN-binding protein [Gordonia sp. (in: high G+C Gram-positive bacteria)]